jgi:glycosyl transferase family 2
MYMIAAANTAFSPHLPRPVMIRECAPIALFVYNRQAHTQRTIEALRRNALAGASDLFIFSDGPKLPDAEKSVAAVRDYIRTIDGFKSVTVIEQEKNRGLAASIIAGVSRMCETHGRVIVLEDDLVTSTQFLSFMNDALDYYADVPQVAAISGYHPPFDVPVPETFFQRDAECWGWATWKRAWAAFNPEGRQLLLELERRELLPMFDQDQSFPYVQMLKDQIAGRNDSWAVRWRASVILRDMLSLYPRSSLTRNIGLDGSGTHGKASAIRDESFANEPIRMGDIPIVHSDAAFQAFARFNRRSLASSLKGRVWRRLRGLVAGLV